MTADDATTVINSESDDDVLLQRLRKATAGEYDVFGVLGKGGMATVFLAHDLSLDRKVAIKVMAPELVHGTEAVARFKREARTAANLSHANIIPIYAVREADGLNFSVQKLIKGTALDSIIRELGQLPISMARAILGQVCDALDYAHRQGVIHRDIKPANILIDDEGWAIVTDFGIAKVQDTNNLTVSGMSVGTPRYMSPEQCNGGLLTGAADQYSLGIVAFEMIAGHPPFVGASMMALMNSHFNEPPPSLMKLRPDCPRQLNDAVMRMLSKEPEDRWGSLQDAAKAAGAVPLDRDDPMHAQLRLLARTSTAHQVIAQFQTPRSSLSLERSLASPMEFARVQSSADTVAPTSTTFVVQKRKHPLLIGSAVVVVLAVGIFLTRQFRSQAPVVPGNAGGDTTVVQSLTVADGTRDGAAARPGDTLSPSTNAAERPTPAIRESNSAGAAPPKINNQRLPSAPPATQAPVGDSGTPPAGKTVLPPPSVITLPNAPTVATETLTTTNQRVAAPARETPPSAPVVVDARPEVAAAIQSFTRALASGDMAAARRIYPTMPADQRDGLTALWKDGGSMTPRWTVSEITIDGGVATARVQGVNVMAPKRGPTTNAPISLLARLERRGAEWRLVSLQNL